MSIGPASGVLASIAGSPLAQTSGSDVDRARHDTTARDRHVQSVQKADSASGIGETDGQEHETNERDADGRRAWEIGPPADTSSDQPAADQAASVQSKDATGESGNSLDLTC